MLEHAAPDPVLEGLIHQLQLLAAPVRAFDAQVAIASGLYEARYSGEHRREVFRDRSQPPADPWAFAVPEFTHSIDAALLLLPQGWAWCAGTRPGGGGASIWLRGHACDTSCDFTAASPAMALCAAGLRARITMREMKKHA